MRTTLPDYQRDLLDYLLINMGEIYCQAPDESLNIPNIKGHKNGVSKGDILAERRFDFKEKLNKLNVPNLMELIYVLSGLSKGDESFYSDENFNLIEKVGGIGYLADLASSEMYFDDLIEKLRID